MDYKDFIESMRQDFEEEQKRRRSRRQATIERNKDKNVVERLGDALNGVVGVGKAVGGFAKDVLVDPVIDSAKTAGEGLGYAIEDVTGITEKRNQEYRKQQDEYQAQLLEQIKKKKDPSLSQEERDRADRLAKSISEAMNQNYANFQGDIDTKLEATDPLKQAGATVNLATTLLPARIGPVSSLAGRFATPAAEIGARSASRIGQAIGADAALGAIGGLSDTLSRRGSDASVEDIAKSAVLGLGGGALFSGVGAAFNRGEREVISNAVRRGRGRDASITSRADDLLPSGNPEGSLSDELRNAMQRRIDAEKQGANAGVIKELDDAVQKARNNQILLQTERKQITRVNPTTGEKTVYTPKSDQEYLDLVRGIDGSENGIAGKVNNDGFITHVTAGSLDDGFQPTVNRVAPGEIDPVTGLRNNAVPEGNAAGIVVKSRDQIMKDNKVQRSFNDRVNEALFDVNAPLADYAKNYKAKTGMVLDVEKDPHALAQLRNGMDEAGAARLGQLTNDMEFIRSNKLAKEWKEYGIANQVVNDRNGIYADSIVAAERKKLEEMQRRLTPEQFEQVKNAVQQTIEFQDSQLQRMRDAGFISQAGYDAIKEVNPNYFTRFNFADYIDDNQRLFASTNSNNISKNLIQAVKGQGENAKYIIEDPAEAITRAAIKQERMIQSNKIFHAIGDLEKTLPEMAIKVRDADKVAKRMDLSLENKELRPIRNQLDRAIKRDAATARRLETEINRLEKQGLKLSLRKGGQRMSSDPFSVAGLGGDVPTAKAGTPRPGALKTAIDDEIYQRQPGLFYGDETPRVLSEDGSNKIPRLHIDDLKQYGYNESIPATYKRKSGNRDIDKLAKAAGYDDVDTFMENIIDELDLRATSRGNAKNLAEMRRNPDVIRAASKNVETFDTKLGKSDTRSFVAQLIEDGSQADINKIKKMVGKRDQKLYNLLDEISDLKTQYDDKADQITKNIGEIRGDLSDIDVPEGYEAISGWRNGIKEVIAVPQYIADAYKGKNDAQVGATERILSAASKPFKAAATIFSPAFLVKNSIRDTGTHWLTSQNISKAERLAILPYARRWAQGFKDSLTNSEFAQKIAEEGGGAAGVFNSASDVTRGTQNMVNATVKSLTGEEIKDAKTMFSTAMDILGKYSGFKAYSGAMQRAGRALEYAPRLAEARAAIEKGMSDPAAALAARNAIGDLQNGGTVSRLLNNYTPFFNSILQGNRRVVQAAIENPKNFAAMTGAGIILPAVSGYLWNRTMYPDVLANISEYERENNFLIILGDEKDEDGRYTQVIKIPKNDAAKVIGNNFEAAMEKLAGEDTDTFAELFMKTIGYAQPFQVERDGKPSLSAMLGSAPLASNPVIRTPFELATNKSLFTGRDIVPEYLQGLNAEDQIQENTPAVDAAIARVTGISPQQIGSVRQGVSAGLLNGDNPVDQVSKVVSGSSSTRGSNEFYRISGDVTNLRKKASNAINKAIEEGDLEGAQKIASEYNEMRVQMFAPWVEKYSDTATDEMYANFEALRLNLSRRSIKQRRESIKERAK